MVRRFTKYPSNYVKANSDQDSGLWRKCVKLHNALFDYMGFDSEDEDYDKYAQEDATFGIYEDVKAGKDVKEAVNDVFNTVYAADIPASVLNKYYKQIFK